VTVVNGSTNSVAEVIQTGGSPYAGVFDPWNKMLYVADGNLTADWVDVISTDTNQIVSKIGLTAAAAQLTVDSLTGDLLVGTHMFSNERQDYAGNFTMVSAATNKVTKTFVWSPYVYSIVSDNATGAVYFLGHANLTVFNATTMAPVYGDPINSSAYLMALDSTDDTLWIVNPSYYVGVPGSVDIYSSPLPIPPPASSSWGAGWNSLAATVAIGSVVTGALTGSVTWSRLRSRRE
jgi:DNA-binding beta-propeller fold protein YncE